MNLIELTQSLGQSIKFITGTVLDVLKLVNPAKLVDEDVFKNMRISPKGMLYIYLMAINIPLAVGYFVYLVHFQLNPYSVDNSLKVAARYYLIGLVLPISMSYALYLFDTRLLRRKIPYAEALTLFTLALSPGILSGFFRIIDQTFVLHILLMMYSIYLVYAGMSLRFGEERITLTFLFLISTGIICSIITFVAFSAAAGIPNGYY